MSCTTAAYCSDLIDGLQLYTQLEREVAMR